MLLLFIREGISHIQEITLASAYVPDGSARAKVYTNSRFGDLSFDVSIFALYTISHAIFPFLDFNNTYVETLYGVFAKKLL